MKANQNGILIWMAGAGVVLALALSLGAQQQTVLDRATSLRADVKMILVPVNVVDRNGAIVVGLHADNFTVLDEKVTQKIISFSSEDSPCSVALVLDLSGSMKHSLGQAKEALAAFLGTANPKDEFALLGVSSKPVIYPVGAEDGGEFTGDTGTIENSIQFASPGGYTALVDTVWAAVEKMRSARNSRRALVIISDGMDNHSRHTRQELVRFAEEADVQIHTVALDGIPYEQKAIAQIEARRGIDYLAELSEKTGGVHLTIRDRSETSSAAEQVGRAIRNQYLIGFQPRSGEASGKWHRVQVKLDREQVNVYARSGYFAN